MSDKVYSIDEEEFFEEMDDALQRLESCPCIGQTIYIGTKKQKKASSFFDVEFMIEHMQDQAYDDAGEWSEGFFEDVSKEKIKELETMIKTWIDKEVFVNFWQVSDVKEYALTEDDVSNYSEETF